MTDTTTRPPAQRTQRRAAPDEPGGARRQLPGPLSLRRPWLIVGIGFFLLLIAFGAAGGPAHLKAGGFDNPSSDSSRAAASLERLFPASQPNLVILVTDRAGGAGSTQAAAAGRDLLTGLAGRPGVHLIGSYYSTPTPELRSKDGTAGLTLVRVDGDEDTSSRTTSKVYADLGRKSRPVPVTFSGIAQINNETNNQVNSDLALAEGIALPLTLLLLVFVFRGVIAALLPAGIGVLSIVGSLGALNALSNMTSVSVFAVQLVTTLGLGLAIDYSLLIVARYRDERGGGVSDRQALITTLRTAGRTVLFSAAVVACTLAALLVFPLYFLRSSAYAGLAVVAVTLVGALVLLPALLLLLGERVEKWSLPARGYAGGPAERRWGRIAGRVMRRPMIFAIPVVGLLIAMAVPLGSATFGVPDERMLPAHSESRVVAETLKTQFGVTSDGAVSVVAANWGSDAAARADLSTYARRLSLVARVAAVESSAGRFVNGQPVGARTAVESSFSSGPASWLQLETSVVSYSAQGRALANDVRAVSVPGQRTVLVGGAPAQLVDIIAAITDQLPLAITLIVGLTLLLLFLLTGSVLLPLKALVFNVLTLGSVFGVMVWIFADGHLGALGVTPAPIAIAIPVLFFCVAFGLSMDYEVFLLSRIKERYEATGELTRSVREGLGSSGPVITMAAAVLAVSFFAMTTSAVTPIRVFGLGTGIAILIDAVLVRGVLVPAFLKLAEPVIWWAPRPLRALHRRFGLTESE